MLASLPETPGGERNWDYRYSWIRDSTFALWGLYTLGFDWEANDFFYFVAELAERDSQLQVMYGIGGERELEELELDHLHGYEGAQPVRIGNGAYRQRQHDIWGAFLDSVYLHTRSRDHLDERIWPILVRQVEAALEHWRLPDRGIWEVRGEPRHFTSSKVMCWVAADRGARLARLREDWPHARRWQAAADEIKADILANALDERGVFTQHYDTTALDASALLLPLLRFLPADDERIVRTVHAIADELTEDGMVLRYRTDETDDGLSGREGSFVICSFWLVSALVEIGDVERARQLCEKLLGICLSQGGDYADLFFEYRRGGGFVFDEGILKSASRSVSAASARSSASLPSTCFWARREARSTSPASPTTPRASWWGIRTSSAASRRWGKSSGRCCSSCHERSVRAIGRRRRIGPLRRWQTPPTRPASSGSPPESGRASNRTRSLHEGRALLWFRRTGRLGRTTTCTSRP